MRKTGESSFDVQHSMIVGIKLNVFMRKNDVYRHASDTISLYFKWSRKSSNQQDNNFNILTALNVERKLIPLLSLDVDIYSGKVAYIQLEMLLCSHTETRRLSSVQIASQYRRCLPSLH